MLTIAAAGALTAVTALPAMAFENEFHGIYNFNTVFSNYNNGGGGDFNPAGLKDNNKMNNYFEQRTRLQYTAKASDDLKLVTHFEINNRFGNTTSAPGGGAGIDTDGANLVTKHAYLDFNVGKSFNAKTGLMPYKDTIKGIFIDADVPAVVTTTKLGSYTLALAYSRFGDDAANGKTGIATGSANKDLFIMDNIFALSKDTKVGFSYYLLADYSDSTGFSKVYTKDLSGYVINHHNADQAILLNTFALSGETKVAGINLSGFAAMQAGHMKNTQGLTLTPGKSTYFHGWAANVAASTKVGPGTAKTAFLFTSGGNGTDAGHYKGWVSSSVNSYNEGGMMILARNTYNSPTSTDQYIRRDIQNLALLTMGYDAQLTEKFNLNTNVGFGWLPASTGPVLNAAQTGLAAAGNGNGSDFLGTEINMEAGYQLYKNLKVMALGGYMILGGAYKDSITKTNGAVGTPENPYTMRLQARYSF